MKAALVDPIGLDNLRTVEFPDPTPGDNEVLVALKHASLNYRDILAVNGGYGRMQKQDKLIPLSDGAGEVIAVGAKVREWKPGDRVVSCFFPDWQAGPLRPECVRTDLGGMFDGVAVEKRIFRPDALVRVPDKMALRDASTLTCAAATAWNAVIEAGKAGPGERVLVQGTGGVSLFALQFAVAAGAEVYATVSSPEKADLVKKLGASHVVNYREDADWGKTVMKMTGGRGIDHVVEIGGAETLKQSMLSLKLEGNIYMIGVVTGPKAELNVPIIAMSGTTIRGISAGSRASLKRMVDAIAHHNIKPVIDDSAFTIDTLRDALLHLKSGRHTGKVVVDIA
jgi:NADPH:quinone reductase-like Zn-dependent oxidoreductase